MQDTDKKKISTIHITDKKLQNILQISTYQQKNLRTFEKKIGTSLLQVPYTMSRTHFKKSINNHGYKLQNHKEIPLYKLGWQKNENNKDY